MPHRPIQVGRPGIYIFPLLPYQRKGSGLKRHLTLAKMSQIINICWPHFLFLTRKAEPTQ